MAQVIMSIKEYKHTENRLTAIGELKEKVRSSGVFEDSASCWNTENDIIRPFTLEETKALVKQILEL